MTQEEKGESLRKIRVSLGLDQYYMGAKIGRTQVAYSNIEKGKVKFTDKLTEELKAIEGFENFDLEPAPPEPLNTQKVPLLYWPWGTRNLYIFLAVLGILILNMVQGFTDDISRGMKAGNGGAFDLADWLTLIFMMPYLFLIYWLLFRKKWKRKKESV